MTWINQSFVEGKSTVPRSRVELARLGSRLAGPYLPKSGLSMLAVEHDPGCPLETSPSAECCLCAPNIDLILFDPEGRPVRIRLMEDGAIVNAPESEPL
jgi:hypothetical protein